MEQMPDPLDGGSIHEGAPATSVPFPVATTQETCAATLIDGVTPCDLLALHDSRYCGVHHVKHSHRTTRDIDRFREQMMLNARHELLKLSPTATTTIGELILDAEVPPNVRLKAATEVLDRIGIRGGQEVDVRAEIIADPSDDIRRRLAAMADGLRAQEETTTTTAQVIAGEIE